MLQVKCKLFLLLTLIVLVTNGELLSTFQKCHVDDEACLLAQAHVFLKTFAAGIPELGMSALEPLTLGDIVVHSGNQRSIKFDLFLTDTQLFNFTQMQISSIKGFTKNIGKQLRIEFNSTIPELFITAKYKVNGKILVLPLVSAGEMSMKLTDVQSKTLITAVPIKRAQDRVYLKIINYQITTKLHDLKIDMSNLFNGEKELRENTLRMLNANWQVLSADVQPKINEALQNKLKTILQKFIQNIPYEEYFL